MNGRSVISRYLFLDFNKKFDYQKSGIMRFTFFALICYLLFTVFSISGLQAQTRHTFSAWSAVFSSFKISNKLSIHFDGQVRSGDKWEQLQTILIRPGLHYKVNETQIATIGYAFVQQERLLAGVNDWVPEHRIWEQYIINQAFSIDGHASSLQHRFRLEQRFLPKLVISNNELDNDGYLFAQRLRYFVRSIFPLAPCSKFEKGMFISLQDEIMVNISGASYVNDKFFDQNRAYASLGYRLSKKADIELGYMHQYVAGRNDIRVINSILQLGIYLRL